MLAPRPEPNRQRLIQLDFVRGLAILAVMGYHFYAVPTHLAPAAGLTWLLERVGWTGVDLFFVLSGFLVGGLLVQELLQSGRIRVRRFLARRVLKIWPAYYAYLLVQVLVHKHPRRSFAWQNALHLQNYAGTSLNHTWSLAVEEHFYLVLPAALALLYGVRALRQNMSLLLGLGCALVLLGRCVHVLAFHGGDPQWKTHARLDSLLFGVLLSWWCHVRPEVFTRLLQSRRTLIAVCGLALTFALRVDMHSRWMWTVGYTVNYLGLAALLLLLYGYRGRLTASAPYRVVSWVGLYSYGIYLWHLSIRDPLLHATAHLQGERHWMALMIGQYAAAITLGVLMTKLVELPMLRVRERLFPHGGGALEPATPLREVTGDEMPGLVPARA